MAQKAKYEEKEEPLQWWPYVEDCTCGECNFNMDDWYYMMETKDREETSFINSFVADIDKATDVEPAEDDTAPTLRP